MAYVPFNFGSPKLRKEGGLTVVPQFDTSEVKKNKALYMARNSEIPSLLKEPGELTSDEHTEIQYHRMSSEERLFVGEGDSEVFNAVWLDEQAVLALPHGAQMERLQKLLLRRGKGKFSKYELVIAGRDINQDARKVRRSYTTGFTTTPDHTRTGPAAMMATWLDEQETLILVQRLAVEIAIDALKKYVPQANIDMMDHQAAKNVPLTFGSIENNYFSAIQYNYSDTDEISLQFSLGEAGDLHVDCNDDPRYYTVLMSVSNSPEGSWPGRTMLTGHRAYAVMAPRTILIFKAVHPHLSLGPIKMGNSTRRPYQPSVVFPPLDPERYVFSRLMLVLYPKEAILENSPATLRTVTSKLIRDYYEMGTRVCNSPATLPVALMAFGTMEHMYQWHAEASAWGKARARVLDPDHVIIPTAAQIAAMYQWWAHGDTKGQLDLGRIKKVIDLNNMLIDKTPETQRWAEFTALCRSQLSQGAFHKGKKVGKISWVSADALGSSFEKINPNARIDNVGPKPRTKKQIQEVFGPLPFACVECAMTENPYRGAKLKDLKNHHLNKHSDAGEFKETTAKPSHDPAWGPEQDEVTTLADNEEVAMDDDTGSDMEGNEDIS